MVNNNFCLHWNKRKLGAQKIKSQKKKIEKIALLLLLVNRLFIAITVY